LAAFALLCALCVQMKRTECAKELGERKTNLNAIIEVGKVWNGKSLSGEVERHR
jgi:hypothetical protein